MDKTSKLRWVFLLTLLALTVIAIFYPVDPTPVVVESGLAHQTGVNTKGKQGVAAINGPDLFFVAEGAENNTNNDAENDPFAPRGWVAAPITQSVVTPVAPVEIAAVTLPVVIGPPPLPFQFTGRMNDNNEQVIYLSHGDQMLLARQGETLESTYKVVTIEPLRIEFEHLPTGEKQTLALPASDN